MSEKFGYMLELLPGGPFEVLCPQLIQNMNLSYKKNSDKKKMQQDLSLDSDDLMSEDEERLVE